MIKSLRSLFINKTLVVLSFLLTLSSISYSQTYTMCSGAGTVSTCVGSFYDSGGSGGNYANSENCTKTFTSSSGNHIICHFTSFSLESNYDYLKVYDGPTAASPLLGSYSGSTVPSDLISTGTSLTFVFTSDGSVVYAGWAANLSCSASPNVQDCMGAIPLCFSTYSTTASYTGTGNITGEIPASGGCPGNCLLSGEKNDVWYTFTVQSSGLLDFRLNPVNSGSSGDDYDWAVYNLTNNNCADVLNNNSAVQVSCNYAVDAAGANTGAYSGYGSDNCEDASGDLWNASIPVTAGQTYVINISNFSSTQDGYTLDFSNTTASIIDNVAPSLNSVTTPIPCGSNTVTVKFSENIECSSVDASDFVLTGPGGPYTVTNISGAGCSLGAGQENQYTLTVSPAVLTSGLYSVGTSSTCSLTDLCGNLNPSSNLLTFTIVGVSASISSQTDATCELSNGSVTALGGGGTSPYTYAWSNAETTATISSVAAGTYICTVSDAFGCQSTTSSTISTTTAAVAPTSTSVDVNNFCSDDAGNITLTATGGSGTTLDWYTGSCGGTSAGSGSILIIPSPTASTTYYASWTNACGASTCSNVPVTVNPAPVAPLTASVDRNNFCADDAGNIQLTATGGSGLTLTWHSGSCGGTSIGTGTPVSIPSPSASTTYYAEWTNGCGTSVCANIPVIVNATPTVDAGIDQTIPTGTSTSLAGTASGGTGPYDYSWDPAGSLLSANVQNPTTTNLGVTTTYTLTVTDQATACSSTDQITVTVSGPPLSVTTSATPNTICSGQSSQLLATASGGSTSYTYSWSSNPAGFSSIISNPTVSPAATTIYTVTVDDGFNTVTSAVTITVNATPTAYNVTGGGMYCSGGVGFVIGLDGSQNGVNYQLLLNSSNLGSPVSGTGSAISFGTQMSVGTYTVIATNATTSCSANMTGSAVITINPTPTANAGSDATIPNGAFTTLSGSASGSTGPYDYLWNPAGSLVNATMQNPTTTNLSVTTVYTLTVTDQSTGCSATDQVTVNITGGPLSVTASATPNTICLGATSQINALASGGSGSYTYSWSSSPAGFASTSSTAFVSPLVNTTYTVTVNDGYNNVTSAVAITVNANPTAFAGNDISICNGSNTTLNATGGTTYLWSPGSGLSATNIPNPVASPGVTTTYTVNVYNASGCSSSDNIVITVLTAAPANAGSDATICSGTAAYLNASGGVSFNWSPPTGLNSVVISNPIATPANTTTYNVIVTDVNGCTNTDAVVVNVNSAVIANAGPDVSICSGTSTLLTASGGNSYSWSPAYGLSSISTSSPTANPLTSTTYVVTVTNSSGCSATDALVVTVNPSVVANAGNDVSICAGTGTVLNATGGTNYLWSPAIGLSAVNVPDPIASPGVNTTYTVVVSNGSGCSASDQVAITVNPLPFADAGNSQTICKHQTISLTATGGSTYQWNNGMSGATINIAPNTTTNYSVTVTSAAGCSSTDNVAINVLPFEPPVIASSGPIGFCFGIPVNTTLDAGTGYSGYQWSNGASSQTINVTAPGTFYVIGSYSNGCSDTSNIVQVQSFPSIPTPVIIASGPTTYCEGQAISVDLYTNTTYYSYHWSSGSYTPVIHVTHPGNYGLTVSDANGCVATALLPMPVTLMPKPVAYMNYSVHGLYTEFFNYSINDSAYSWTFGDDTTSTLENPVHSFNSPGTYPVTLVVTNMCGSDSLTVLITVVSGTDIDETNIVQNLAVYPNPTENLLTISFDNNEGNSISLSITDILGRLIISEDEGKVIGKFSKQINLESLATGVYNLQISTESGSVFRKIIVTK